MLLLPRLAKMLLQRLCKDAAAAPDDDAAASPPLWLPLPFPLPLLTSDAAFDAMLPLVLLLPPLPRASLPLCCCPPLRHALLACPFACC
jgi:hypothetical protein